MECCTEAVFSIPLSCSAPFIFSSDHFHNNINSSVSELHVPNSQPLIRTPKMEILEEFRSQSPARDDDKVKKLKHTLSEQKRRDAIKHGYHELQLIVMPNIEDGSSSIQSISKVAILKNAISFIKTMENKILAAEKHLTSLKEESNATIIIEKHLGTFPNFTGFQYNTENLNNGQLFIFPLFSKFLEYLFNTFSLKVDLSNYENLSLSIVQWLDSFANPDFLQTILHRFYIFEIESNF